jgi:hypothetical protein
MKKWILSGAVAAAAVAAGGSAMAQPYGDYGGGYHQRPAYGYDYGYHYGRGYHRPRDFYRDSDRDGVPDRVEWGRDRDHDGRPDQWDRYDNRRGGHYRQEAYRRGYRPAPYYGYGYRY